MENDIADGIQNVKIPYRPIVVAKGFCQKHVVDHIDTFSLVIRQPMLRFVFALSVQLGLHVTSFDVKTTFLDSDLEETILMKKTE